MPRVRPHFKAHLSAAHHRKMAEVYRDNDLLSLWLRLGIEAIARYAAKNGDTFRLHRSELPALAGGKRRDKAEANLLRLADYLGLGCELVGECWVIHIPKFAQKQGFNWENEPGTPTPDANASGGPPQKGGAPTSKPLPLELVSESVPAPAPPRPRGTPPPAEVAAHGGGAQDDPTPEEREAMSRETRAFMASIAPGGGRRAG